MEEPRIFVWEGPIIPSGWWWLEEEEAKADGREVLVGPAGSFPNVLANMYAGDPQYPVLFAFFNWTRFVCDPDAGTIAVTFIGDDGAVIAERVLAL